MLQDRLLRRAVVAAVLIRVVVVALSAGSNDIFHWWRLGGMVRDSGLVATYEATAYANHPPLAMLYMAAARTISDLVGIPFAWLAKAPAVAAELAIAALLWRVLSRRHGQSAARRVTVAYLFNPVTLLLAAYHGNTDMVYVALVFAAAVAVTHQHFGQAGLLLGAALNVKVLPVVLAPAFVAALLSRPKQLARFATAAAVATAPIVVLLARSPRLIWERMFAYQPTTIEPWGLTGLEIAVESAVDSWPGALWYAYNGRALLVAALVGAAVVAYRASMDVMVAAALGGCVFLTVTPGFAVQYLGLVVPFLFAAAGTRAAVWAAAAGAYLVSAYASTSTGEFPLVSWFAFPHEPLVVGLGLAAWVVTAWFATTLMRQRSLSGDREPVLVG